MNQYKVSICVPVYNVEKYIERCLISLFKQTYADIEYVFINDCTPDESWNILDSVISKYHNRAPYVIRIVHSNNRGSAAVRNTALNYVSGKFILWVDSDDYIDLDFVEKAVCAQQKYNADIVTMRTIHEYNDYTELKDYPYYSSPEDMIKSIIIKENVNNVWGRLIRLSLYKNYHIQCKEGVNVGEDLQQLIPLIYYSKKVITERSSCYHYNCMNNASYMASFSTEKARFSYESLKIVSNFLLMKDEKTYFDTIQYGWVKLISSQIIRLCSSNMICDEYFKFLKDLLKSIEHKYLKMLPKSKQIMLGINNYWLTRKYVKGAKLIKKYLAK